MKFYLQSYIHSGRWSRGMIPRSHRGDQEFESPPAHSIPFSKLFLKFPCPLIRWKQWMIKMGKTNSKFLILINPSLYFQRTLVSNV